ncbi:Rv3235 family protein [Pseudonocardia sp. RS010]|uniref:Rv3235 family protein n=1 Tax=Pseudonocardia sp. RS010 TaxID=3385979 RepID=UPI0039A0133C
MPVSYRVSHDRSTGHAFVPAEPIVETSALDRCPTCGHVPDGQQVAAESVYAGPLVPDVEPRTDARRAARAGVQVLLEAATLRRPLSAAARHATPEVLRYLKALQPTLRALPRGARVARWHAAQPHRWVVEANALVLLDRPQALAARFEPDALGHWTCTAFRIIRGGTVTPA